MKMGEVDEASSRLLERRLQAGQLLLCGVAESEVARQVGVSRTAVREWKARLALGGLEALQPQPRGRCRTLNTQQRHMLVQALNQEALAHGFTTRVWTLPQIKQFIERNFNRTYSDSQVRRLLKALRFGTQRRLERAMEHNDAVLRKWNREHGSQPRRTAPEPTGRLPAPNQS